MQTPIVTADRSNGIIPNRILVIPLITLIRTPKYTA